MLKTNQASEPSGAKPTAADIERRFQLKRCAAPGSGPWGPRSLLPRGGVRTPIRPGSRPRPFCAGRFFYPGPVFFDPAGDGLVVAFAGSAGGALAAPPPQAPSP